VGVVVWPQVLEHHPDAVFQVVGRHPPAMIRDRASENVVVTGYVDDERPYIARNCVYVVPLWEGSGVRLKILTAMAMGRPVLSTSIGSEGISWPSLRISDSREGWVEVLVKAFSGSCASDPGAAEYVRNRYDWRRDLDLPTE
jgi:glycosyltransferase involved in cell wall biosynthesis